MAVAEETEKQPLVLELVVKGHVVDEVFGLQLQSQFYRLLAGWEREEERERLMTVFASMCSPQHAVSTYSSLRKAQAKCYVNSLWRKMRKREVKGNETAE